MGGSITKARRQSTLKKKPSAAAPQLGKTASYSRRNTAALRAKEKDVEPSISQHSKNIVERETSLTEEMMENFTRSTAENRNSKSRKKEVLAHWLSNANAMSRPYVDALELHRQSMAALRTTVAASAKESRAHHSKSDPNCSTAKSRRGRSKDAAKMVTTSVGS